MIDLKQLNKNSIFNLLDSIEDRVGKMAHEIPTLSDKLEAWQNGQTKDIYFINFLTKFIDTLNEV